MDRRNRSAAARRGRRPDFTRPDRFTLPLRRSGRQGEEISLFDLARRNLRWPPPEGPQVRFSPSAFAAWLILALAGNYPGRLNEDSLEQLIGWSNPERLTDLHSPVVTWLWNLAAPGLGQPVSALLIQSLALAFYAAIVPRKWPRGWAAWAALSVESVFKLSLLVSAGFIIKDILLIGMLLSALGAFQLAGSAKYPRTWIAAAVILLLLSLLVRPTNFILLFAAGALVLPFVARSLRGAAILLPLLALVLAASVPLYVGISRVLFGAADGHSERQVQIFDMAGISARTGRNHFTDLEGWPSASLPPPGRCYDPESWAAFAHGRPCGRYSAVIEEVRMQSGRRAIARWWIEGIAANPAAYARHRIDHMSALLGAGYDERWARIRKELGPQRRHLYALNRSERAGEVERIQQGLAAPVHMRWWRESRVSLGFAWIGEVIYAHRWTEALALAFCILLLGWSWMRRIGGRTVPLAVPAAAGLGIGNAAIYLFLGVAAQDRYLFPTVCLAIFAGIAALRSNAGWKVSVGD